MNRNSKVLGPASGHTITCKFCHYRDNSYWHWCTGGNCHLCSKTHSYSFCNYCNKVTCKEHMVYEPLIDSSMCLKCSSEYRQEDFKTVDKVSPCQCILCEVEREKVPKGKLNNG